MKITDEEIKRDTLTCKAATPGPWRREDIQKLNLSWMEAEDCDDQEFISQARTRWPIYIEQVQRLKYDYDLLSLSTRALSIERNELEKALIFLKAKLASFEERIRDAEDLNLRQTLQVRYFAKEIDKIRNG